MPLNVVVNRKVQIAVFLAGPLLPHVKSVQWSGGFNQPYNECKVVVTQLPSSFDNNQSLIVQAGNGTNMVTRFAGFSRSPIYNLDGTITIQGVGQLAYAYQYQNSEDPFATGGLELISLLGSPSGTDQQVVSAVLSRVGINYTGGNIGGTGAIFGLQQVADPDAFIWLAGDSPTSTSVVPGAGESALDYITKWDQISAVHPGPFASAGLHHANSPGAVTSTVGFYRTYETMQGVIYRTVIGGRPRGTPTIATPFTEGVDIRSGDITRGYPVGNRFVAVGFDNGVGGGPEYFSMQSSNPYMPSSQKITCPPITSPFLEKSAENDPTNGMSCERVTYAMEPDLNRIIVSGTITTGRDDYISHGATILVQAPGGLPGRLGTGENVWIQAVRGSASISGFVQELDILGGGVPDNYLPAVAQ
jgi:hypothetical protein